MDAQEAKDAIRACVALCGDCDHADRKCHEFEKGYLGCYEKDPDIKALVEAARKVIEHYGIVHGDMAAQTGMKTGGQLTLSSREAPNRARAEKILDNRYKRQIITAGMTEYERSVVENINNFRDILLTDFEQALNEACVEALDEAVKKVRSHCPDAIWSCETILKLKQTYAKGVGDE